MAVDFDEPEFRLMREFLETATPVEWFVAACTFDYDSSSELRTWMAVHPHLDRATAVALYWQSEPGYYQPFNSESEVADTDRAEWQFVHALQERVACGAFRRQGASFDPRNDEGYDWTTEAMTEADGPAWLIPVQLFEPVFGEDVQARTYAEEAGWDDGKPPSVLALLDETLRAAHEVE